jgi:hypothetical protein
MLFVDDAMYGNSSQSFNTNKDEWLDWSATSNSNKEKESKPAMMVEGEGRERKEGRLPCHCLCLHLIQVPSFPIGSMTMPMSTIVSKKRGNEEHKRRKGKGKQILVKDIEWSTC